jgi:hypothetical protein
MTASTRHGSRKRSPANDKPPMAPTHGRRMRLKSDSESGLVIIFPKDNYEDALSESLFLEGEPSGKDEAEVADDWPARDSEEEDVTAEPDEVSRRGGQ